MLVLPFVYARLKFAPSSSFCRPYFFNLDEILVTLFHMRLDATYLML